jgi:ribosomal protein L40E
MRRRQQSEKKYSCRKCGKDDLTWSWNFATKRRILLENNYTHKCLSTPTSEDEDVRSTKCRHCGSQDVLWVKRSEKYELTESYGLPHICDQFKQYREDYKQALRDNYAFEKKWIHGHADDSECKKCKGRGIKQQKRKTRDGQPWLKVKRCLTCRGIGTFSVYHKKNYLKTLRELYWPYKPWMKWKNAPI